jgi:hypothetical protein
MHVGKHVGEKTPLEYILLRATDAAGSRQEEKGTKHSEVDVRVILSGCRCAVRARNAVALPTARSLKDGARTCVTGLRKEGDARDCAAVEPSQAAQANLQRGTGRCEQNGWSAGRRQTIHCADGGRAGGVREQQESKRGERKETFCLRSRALSPANDLACTPRRPRVKRAE